MKSGHWSRYLVMIVTGLLALGWWWPTLALTLARRRQWSRLWLQLHISVFVQNFYSAVEITIITMSVNISDTEPWLTDLSWAMCNVSNSSLTVSIQITVYLLHLGSLRLGLAVHSSASRPVHCTIVQQHRWGAKSLSSNCQDDLMNNRNMHTYSQY